VRRRGEADRDVLEFDRIEQKRANIGDLAHGIAPLAVLAAEIARCVVRCANCHRRRTARQFGWEK
jgi:hypothetical protein